MGYYLVFSDRLERLGAQGSNSSRDERITIVTFGIDYSPITQMTSASSHFSTSAQAAASSTSQRTSTRSSQSQALSHSPQHTTPRSPMEIVPPSIVLRIYISICAASWRYRRIFQHYAHPYIFSVRYLRALHAATIVMNNAASA
jgi:hypothetical protein